MKSRWRKHLILVAALCAALAVLPGCARSEEPAVSRQWSGEANDSWLLGSEGVCSVELLDEYFGGSFRSFAPEDCGSADLERMTRYIAEQYPVKRIVVALDPGNLPGAGASVLPEGLEPEKSPWELYARGVTEKILPIRDVALRTSYHEWFLDQVVYAESGREAVPVSRSAPERGFQTREPYDACLSWLRSTSALCDSRGIALTVICQPVYRGDMDADLADFKAELAKITDFWDFSVSPLSFDPRYFLEDGQPRSYAGEMMLTRICGGDGIYAPEDFGGYVTAKTAKGWLKKCREAKPADTEEYSTPIPILMYHHVSETTGEGDTIRVDRFEEHMAALWEAGYTAVTFDDLRTYVEQGRELPEKPVVITFDDGYESNLSLAAPILKKYGMKATVFAIGVSIGKDTYKDTGVEMIPHFSLEESTLFDDFIRVESHGYNLHEVQGRDPDPIRIGVRQKEGETLGEYLEYLREDFARMNQIMEEAFDRGVNIMAYPYGAYNLWSERMLCEAGVWATVTSDFETDTIVKGIPQSLRQLGRYTVSAERTAQEILELIRQ